MAKEIKLHKLLVPLELNLKKENEGHRAEVKKRLDRIFTDGMDSVRVLLEDYKQHALYGSAAKDLLRWSLEELGYPTEIQQEDTRYYAIIRKKR